MRRMTTDSAFIEMGFLVIPHITSYHVYYHKLTQDMNGWLYVSYFLSLWFSINRS
eukprot:UN00850